MSRRGAAFLAGGMIALCKHGGRGREPLYSALNTMPIPASAMTKVAAQPSTVHQP